MRVMMLMSQPIPLIIGFTIAQMTIPIIIDRTLPTTLANLLNAVRAGEGVKLVFLICRSFCVIRRYFFDSA